MFKLKIAIVDDHELVLQGLSLLIRDIPSCQLIGKFTSGSELLRWLGDVTEKPDICLIDIEMPNLNGTDLVRLVKERHPEIKVAALTMHKEAYYINRMIVSGADGYLNKDIDLQKFEEALQKMMRGEFFIEEVAVQKTAESHKGIDADALTTREIEIVKLIAFGKTNKDISRQLFISHRTVDTHRTNIKRKLKASSLAEIIQFAYNNGYF